jgi:hypothetical protein
MPDENNKESHVKLLIQTVTLMAGLIAMTAAAETELSKSDWQIVDEALRTPMLARHAWGNGKHEEAVRLLVCPEELVLLEKTHSIQNIVGVLKDRKASRLGKLLGMSRRLRNTAKLSSDKATVFFSQPYCPVKYAKHDGKWYVKGFDHTFHVAASGPDLPRDEHVLAAGRAFINTALRLLEEGKFVDLALHTSLPHDLQVETYGKIPKDFVMGQKKQDRLRTVLTTMLSATPEISWDKECLGYHIAGDDYGLVQYGKKWCLVH